MLLRRMTQHVRNQNWFAVFLDFVIVVVGVFIGIQVANWNEAQNDKALGEDYVASLITELSDDLKSAEAMQNYYKTVFDNLVAADKLLTLPESDSFETLIAIYRATEISYIAPNNATWNQIVSSGHVGLLPSEAVNGGLTQYYAYNSSNEGSYENLRDSKYRILVRSLIPLSIQAQLRTGCSDKHDEVGNIIGFVDVCELNIPKTEVLAVVKKLRNHPRLKELMNLQFSHVSNERFNYVASVLLLKKALKNLGVERQ